MLNTKCHLTNLPLELKESTKSSAIAKLLTFEQWVSIL